MYRMGIDIGSVSVKLVVLDDAGNIRESRYIRHKGKPIEIGKRAIQEEKKTFNIDLIAATGTGAKIFADLIGAAFVNEIVAISRAFSHLRPDAGSVIDIGGEDAKLIIFEEGRRGGTLRVKDFSMNALCAAGTGSFLDQQASRLCFTIEEFSNIALKSKNPPRIAGRCTVFAKSDMIHLQQIATPDYEIVAGLCYALARNFKSNVAKGKEVKLPVAFIGGVAANAGMRKAMKDVFSLEDGAFFVPEYFTSMGAIGAVYAVLDDLCPRKAFLGLDRLDEYFRQQKTEGAREPLVISEENLNISYDLKEITERTKVYLGVDVGSISTNLVVIDEHRQVIAKQYLMTEGRPLEAVKIGLAGIGGETGDNIEIMGAGTTGSGRYLTADFIGADIVRNEITAQAEAAINIDPHVDTIFEIGGQDSKYISVDHGVIVDFEMNKACAAGTGSYLEEQAEKLGISIKNEFGDLALSSEQPVKMGERCTVFMESDLIHHQQRGAKTDDLVSGLCYSIVANYLNKVVGDKRIGEKIFFQGGTAFNKGVVAAFEKVLKKPIKVPPHHDVTGAIGVAILAMKEKKWEKSSFKGFDLSKRQYRIDTFECKGCENLCEIRKVTIENEAPLFYGSRCERYDVVRRTEKRAIKDLFSIRNEMLQGIYDKKVDGKTIGIPMILSMHELLPFWKAFFSELGFSVVLSDPTNNKTIREGVENIIVESCFPVKLAHGHVLNLVNRGVKRILIPSVINMRRQSEHTTNTLACPYAQSIPYTVRASIDFRGLGVLVESPIVYFGEDRQTGLKGLLAYGKNLGKSGKEIKRAFDAATEAQDLFSRRCVEKGREFLESLGDDEKGMVVVGRPYNSIDPGANLNIHKKLIDLGVKPVPLDMLPLLDTVERDEDIDSMYWGYGQKILRAAKFIAGRKNLYGVYVTNFGCGPDSFITHFFKKALQGKPFLQLEIDEHSADAGIVTRMEAFLDSIKNAKVQRKSIRAEVPHFQRDGRARKIFIPYMSDHAFGIASAFRACGVEAEVMEKSNEETVYWGRKFTTGKECYPCILTTGDMIKTLGRKDFDASKSAFLMPSGGGPCRFGQYNRFHRLVLDDLGFQEVPIYAPNQDYRLYSELKMLGGEFSRFAWKGIVATDLLVKMLHEIRPYEEHDGETDRVYRKALSSVLAAVENGEGGIIAVLEEAVGDFLRIPRKKTGRPIVGIVGEIYIRSNGFSNDNLVRKVEQFGGQVWLAPVAEWITYVNYVSRRKSRKKAGFNAALRLILTDYLQRKEEQSMEKPFREYLKYGEEPKMQDIIRKASPYVDISFEGEAILSVGKGIDFIDKGVCGLVNAMPFTCMPGTISSTIMKLVQDKFNVPIITVAYDGQGATNITTRLEAFMYQVKEQYQENS